MKKAIISAFACLAIAGTGHLFAAPTHMQHTTAHGLFLLFIGVAQVGWALAWLRWRTCLMALSGLALSGGVLLLWILLYTVPSPFVGHLALHARTVDWLVVTTKVAEAIGCGALLWLLPRLGQNEHAATPWRSVYAPAGLTVAAVGCGLWLVAIGIEPLWPDVGLWSGWPTPRMLTNSLATPVPSMEADDQTTTPTYAWDLPAGFPLPRTPEGNPMTDEKVELGRYLFYDTRLSGNGAQSCESCHFQALAFSDGKVTPQGSTGETLERNSPALVNVAYNSTLTWANPVLTELERQVLIPLFAEFPVEMGVTGHEEEVLARLQADQRYQEMFAAAFPADAAPINYHNVVQALASFVRSLISGNSAHDRYLAGDKAALSPAARRGMELFFSERFECHHCHVAFNFSAATVHANSTFSANTFQNNGLYNLDGQGAYPRGNRGLYEITGVANDMGRFRPPTLRNVELTAPYMHDGSLATLEDVIRHYAAGGREITEGPNQGDGRRNPFKSPLVPGFTITDEEVADLASFLRSLTDTDFTTNPQTANPFIRTVSGK
jgi:cytochrome c peroxidase